MISPTTTAASLFTDGVHSTMAFLNNTDWMHCAFVSKHWYQAAISNRPPRGFEWQMNSTQKKHKQTHQQMLDTILASLLARKHLTHMTLVDIDQHRLDFSHFLMLLRSLSSLHSLKGVQLNATSHQPNDTHQSTVPETSSPNISFVSHLRELEVTSVTSVGIYELIQYVAPPTAFPRLTSLTLHNLTLSTDLAPLATSSSLTELHLLQYATNSFTRECPPHSVIVSLEMQMNDISRIPNLTHFRLGNQMAQHVLIDRFDDPNGPTIRFPRLQYFPTMRSIGRFSPGILPNMHLAMPGLRELALLDFFSEEINVCTQFEHLDTIVLRVAFPRIENPLELLSQCRGLTHLKLIGGTTKLEESWRATFESLPLLTKLTFTKSDHQEWNISACLTALVQSNVLEIISKRLTELNLIEIPIKSFEFLTQITQLTSLQTLRIQRCDGPQVMTPFVVRETFNNVDVLPHLQHFELCLVSVWFDRQPTNEVTDEELRASFVWDVKTRKNRDWFRVGTNRMNAESVVIPLAAPLVGIELNPGPTQENSPEAILLPASPTSAIFPSASSTSIAAPVTATASSLFTDGLHLIFSYLTTVDWVRTSRASRYWLKSGASSRSRRLIVRSPISISSSSISSLSSSSSSLSSSLSTSRLIQLLPWQRQLQISATSLSRHIVILNLNRVPIEMTNFIAFVNGCTEVEVVSAWVKEDRFVPFEVVGSMLSTPSSCIISPLRLESQQQQHLLSHPIAFSSQLRELSLNLQHLISLPSSSSSSTTSTITTTTTTAIEFILRGLTSFNSRLTSIQLDHLPFHISLDSLTLLPSLSRLTLDHYGVAILLVVSTSTPAAAAAAADCASLRSQWQSLHRLASLRHLSINRGVLSCIRLARLLTIDEWKEAPATAATATATTTTTTTPAAASASVVGTTVQLSQVETFELNLTADVNQLIVIAPLRRLLPNAKFERTPIATKQHL